MIIKDLNGNPLSRDEQFKVMVNELKVPREQANLMLAMQFDGVKSDLVNLDSPNMVSSKA